jgi:PncC family amidohydrolase
MNTVPVELRKAARDLARLLTRHQDRLVLAESCTGGLLASLLTETPGTSNHFCGSQVVYRVDSKRQWLGVRSETLKNSTPVSRKTAEEMVRGILRKTPEATIAAAITGFLGPKGEPMGRVFISVLKRSSKEKRVLPVTVELEVHPLTYGKKAATSRRDSRIPPLRKSTYARLARRDLAALATLFLVRASLEV